MFSRNNFDDLLENFQDLVGYLNKRYHFAVLIRQEFWQESPIRKDKNAPDETGDYLFEWSYLPRPEKNDYLVYIRIMPAFYNDLFLSKQQEDCAAVRKCVDGFLAKYGLPPITLKKDECRYNLNANLIPTLMIEAREYRSAESKSVKNGLFSTASGQSNRVVKSDAAPERKFKNSG